MKPKLICADGARRHPTESARRFPGRFQRIVTLLRRRGTFGFLRFAFGRVVYRKWRTQVYRDDPEVERSSTQWPPGYRFELCHRPMDMAAVVKSALEAAGGRDLLSDLDPGDRLYLVWH